MTFSSIRSEAPLVQGFARAENSTRIVSGTTRRIHRKELSHRFAGHARTGRADGDDERAKRIQFAGALGRRRRRASRFAMCRARRETAEGRVGKIRSLGEFDEWTDFRTRLVERTGPLF